MWTPAFGRGHHTAWWTLLLAAAVGLTAAALGLRTIQPQSASSESLVSVVREGEIGEPGDVDSFVLFALTGDSVVLSLEHRTLHASRISVWRPATDGSEARRVARSAGNGAPLVWTAPHSGAWRVQVSGVNGATGSYRLSIRTNMDAVGADLFTARAGAFDERGILIERSFIDQAGDVDWFAFPVASGNRYTLWSVRGSIGGLSGALRPPSAESFQPLDLVEGLVVGELEPTEDGIAVLAVGGSDLFQVGSYAVGVTRRGEQPEPVITLPVRPAPELRIQTIEAAAVQRDHRHQAEFAFRGEWGPIRQSSGLRVWIDTDPGADDDDEWEYLLRSNDGRRASLWSFDQQAWVDSSRIGARGFDTLIMRWSGRTADELIRWQASVKNSDGTWTLARPQLLEIPHPQPTLPPLWFSRERTGPEDPRFHEELEAAGVVKDLDDDALVVVLDPGHGVETGAWDNGILEAESNLAFALRIEELLEARGIHVALTRRAPGRPYLNLDQALWRPDYQVRAELAHLARADLFVSIHSNANYLQPIRGLEAWYYPRRNGDEANLRLSETLLTYVQRALARYGYRTSTLIYDSSCWELVNGVCDPIYVLAPFLLVDADVAQRWGFDPLELGLSEDPYDPARNEWLWRNDITVGEPPIDLIVPETQTGPGTIIRGNLMPTVLLELLYATHEADARILRDPAAREVIAQAIADGILYFLEVE
ncbi:MAG: N-acetylmuramoyl-L-alanine amidase [Chloroflexi bacterium]|nr:N-acetylmuramoyl-L-alanine amidase [Chloroflexota bacterium]